MYEPIQHRIKRNFYEAELLKSDENASFNYQSNKEIESFKRTKAQQSQNKENIVSDQFDVNKIVHNLDSYKSSQNIYQTISTQDNVSFSKKSSPSKSPRTTAKQGKILEMIINSDNERVPGMLTYRSHQELPISILKNRIRPRDPSYPDKCLTGYENLRNSSPDNIRSLSTMINDTCQKVMTEKSYIKKMNSNIDWKKCVKGKSFFKRINDWMHQRELKIEHMKYIKQVQEDQEIMQISKR